MFYAKTQLNDATILTLGIHEDNVYTRCPHCDLEIAVDLSEVFVDFSGDLYSTSVLCTQCSRRAHKEAMR